MFFVCQASDPTVSHLTSLEHRGLIHLSIPRVRFPNTKPDDRAAAPVQPEVARIHHTYRAG